VTALLMWGLRLLVVLLVLRMVFRAFAGRRSVPTHARPRIGGTLVRDPQCGTYLPPDRALTLTTANGVIHFCSPGCRDTWTSSHA
jgi:hypothetical protein